MQTNPPDQVTVLVFKDNYASRTFQIPLKWFGRFGLLLGAMAGITFVSLFFALKYYQVSKAADPGRMKELEEALVDIKTRALAPVAVPVTTAAPTAGTTAPHTNAPLLFSAVPSLVTAPPANLNAVPITIQSPVLKWSGRSLTAHFELQYILLDKGSQQGRILLLARGPSTFLSYPTGALNPAGKDSLIDPEKGEYFSVSRIRAVEAHFGPMPAGHDITQLEVLILSSTFQILIHQILPVSATGEIQKPVEVAPVKTAPPVHGVEPKKHPARHAAPAVTEDSDESSSSDDAPEKKSKLADDEVESSAPAAVTVPSKTTAAPPATTTPATTAPTHPASPASAAPGVHP